MEQPVDVEDDASLYRWDDVPYPSALRHVPWHEAAVKVALYVTVTLVSLTGNLLVVATVWRVKRMHTTTNYYLVNLAVADLAVTASCGWVQLVDELSEGWVLGAFFCRLNSAMQVLSHVSSTLTLTLIACDRFFGIVFALKARATERRCCLFLLGVWGVAALTALPLVIHREQFTRVWLNHTEVWCGDTWPTVLELDASTNHTALVTPGRTAYFTLVTLVLFFLPVTVLVGAYSAVVRTLWAHRPPGDDRPPGNQLGAADRQQRTVVKQRIILMLVVLTAVFTFCWLPYQVSILHAEYRQHQHLPLPSWYERVKYFAMFVAYANSAVNPLIYACFNTSFRKGCLEMCRVKKPPAPSALMEIQPSCGSCRDTLELRLDTRVGDAELSRHHRA